MLVKPQHIFGHILINLVSDDHYQILQFFTTTWRYIYLILNDS